MTDTSSPGAKPAVQSTTILASITAAAPAVVLLADDLGQIVHDHPLSQGAQLLAAGALVTLAGAVAAIWGRVRATAPISGLIRTGGAK